MVPADRFCFPTGQTGLYGRRRNFRLSAAAKEAAEKTENAVIRAQRGTLDFARGENGHSAGKDQGFSLHSG